MESFWRALFQIYYCSIEDTLESVTSSFRLDFRLSTGEHLKHMSWRMRGCKQAPLESCLTIS